MPSFMVETSHYFVFSIENSQFNFFCTSDVNELLSDFFIILHNESVYCRAFVIIPYSIVEMFKGNYQYTINKNGTKVVNSM